MATGHMTDSVAAGATESEEGGGFKIDFSLGGKVRELRTMSANQFSGLETGQTGATLQEVASHAAREYPGYGLINEEFLAGLRTDHSKIADLMDALGETRDEVSIVAQTGDGTFTRMLLKRDPNGKYEEAKKDVESDDKTKTHMQAKDLFIFEKGVQAMAA